MRSQLSAERLAQHNVSDTSSVVVVLDEAFPKEPGRLASYSYYLPPNAISDFPTRVTPLLLEPPVTTGRLLGSETLTCFHPVI